MPLVTPHDVDAHGVLEAKLPRPTFLSLHQPRSWLKDEAFQNMCFISALFLIGQPLRSWLNFEALWNINLMLPTRWTAQSPMSRLNAEAPRNILFIVTTPETSHAPMSSLKEIAAELHLDGSPPQFLQNKNAMFVTPDVSQVEMWPYVASAAVGSASHASTAVWMLSLSSAMLATASNKLTAHRNAAGLIIVAQGQPYPSDQCSINAC